MKLVKIILFFSLFVVLVPITKACVSTDWKFTLNIGTLELNQEKLESLCDEKSCYIADDFIVIRSKYDERVAIVVGKTSSILGFNGITFRLPYAFSDGTPTISEVDPEDYDWQNLVRTDLKFLNDIGILEISSQDMEKITSLATNGKNIFFCNSTWQALEANCFCKSDEITGEEIICVRCIKPPLDLELPKTLLTPKKASVNKNFLIFFVLIVLAVAISLAIRKSKKCCKDGEELSIIKITFF